MIVSKTVMTSWNSSNKDYYASKGYKVPKKMKTPLEVDIEDLAPQSKIKIDVECDMCHKLYHPSFINYNKRKLGMDLCNTCAHKYFVGDIISNTKMKNSKYSLYDWCIENVWKDFIENYWSDKNILNPKRLSYKSGKNIWIKCVAGLHSDYETTCVRFTQKKNFLICPECTSVISSLQRKVNKYITERFGENDITHESKCSIVPINPVTNMPLRFDNCIESLKIIIEVNGSFHYRKQGFTISQANKKGTTPEEELEYQQWKDQYKKEYALSHGYEYLEIPYTAEANDKYKQLIDDKIAEINNKLKGEQTHEIN